MTKKRKKKKSKAIKKIRKVRRAKSKTKRKIISESRKGLIIKISKAWAKRAYVNKKKYEKKYNLSI